MKDEANKETVRDDNELIECVKELSKNDDIHAGIDAIIKRNAEHILSDDGLKAGIDAHSIEEVEIDAKAILSAVKFFKCVLHIDDANA